MASALWGKFASEVLKEVRFKYDHNDIRQELVEHMEELCDDLVAEGMDIDVAEQMVVVYMGEAKEIGQALDKEHNPWLGWLWQASRWAVVAAIIVSFFAWGFGAGKTIWKSVTAEYKNRVVSPIAYKMDIDEKVKWYDAGLYFDELIYYEDEMMELRYSYLNWREDWNTTDKFDKTDLDLFYVQDGAVYRAGEQLKRKLGAGVYSKNEWFARIPAEADKLIVMYDQREMRIIEIELLKGGEP